MFEGKGKIKAISFTLTIYRIVDILASSLPSTSLIYTYFHTIVVKTGWFREASNLETCPL
jgi:hypothetical protein